MAFLAAAPLFYASLAATAVSTGVAVYSSTQQAKAAEDAADFNAKLAKNEAALTQQRTLENIRRKRTRNRRFLSRQNALIAGRGITLEGTALEILGQSASTLELDVFDSLNQGQLSINKSLSQASMAEFDGSQAASSQRLSAAGTLLSGVTRIGGRVATARDQGIF